MLILHSSVQHSFGIWSIPRNYHSAVRLMHINSEQGRSTKYWALSSREVKNSSSWQFVGTVFLSACFQKMIHYSRFFFFFFLARQIDVVGTLWLLLLSHQFQSKMQTFRNDLNMLLCPDRLFFLLMWSIIRRAMILTALLCMPLFRNWTIHWTTSTYYLQSVRLVDHLCYLVSNKTTLNRSVHFAYKVTWLCSSNIDVRINWRMS